MTRTVHTGLGRSLALGLLATALAVVATVLAVVARARERTLTVYAHRGFASVAAENTVEAARVAVRSADGLEVDVRRCATGELVCAHDSDLGRITRASGRVEETGWEVLRTLTVGDSDARIASLDELLDVVPVGFPVVLELKTRGLADDVLAAVDRHGVDATISSFDVDALRAARERDGELSLAYTFRSDVDRALAVADELGCDAVHPRADLCLRSRLVSRAHRRGLDVAAWTVDSRFESLLLALVDVDVVFADRPLGTVESNTSIESY